MLATPLVIKRVSAQREAAQAKLDEAQALTRYGFHLQEVSQQAGVHFIHQAPSFGRQARRHYARGCIDGCFGIHR